MSSRRHRDTATHIDVSRDLGGVRLSKLLADRLSLSLSQVNRLFDQGKVRFDGRVARRKHKGVRLDPGQTVSVEPFARPGDVKPVAQKQLDVPIIAADDAAGWVVVNKPAGMPVHPLEPGETGTALNALAARYPSIHTVGDGGLRGGVVHRLDVDTSGVLAFATNQPAWDRLRNAFKEHRTTKLYRAIVLGELLGEGEERMRLTVAQHRPAKVAVIESAQASNDDDGSAARGSAANSDDHTGEASDDARREPSRGESKPKRDDSSAKSKRDRGRQRKSHGRAKPQAARWCDLKWRVVESLRGATLIEVSLGTGFLHQIRVMMAQLGHPIAGDAHYLPSGMTDDTAASRPMLHAHRLAVEDLSIDATAAPPADFTACVERLRG